MKTSKAAAEPAEHSILADADALPPAAPEMATPAAIPDPVTAIGEDGLHRPMSGGSFIRQSDGTLVRSDDNG